MKPFLIGMLLIGNLFQERSTVEQMVRNGRGTMGQEQSVPSEVLLDGRRSDHILRSLSYLYVYRPYRKIIQYDCGLKDLLHLQPEQD